MKDDAAQNLEDAVTGEYRPVTRADVDDLALLPQHLRILSGLVEDLAHKVHSLGDYVGELRDELREGLAAIHEQLDRITTK